MKNCEEYGQLACRFFAEGHNCAQSVLMAYAEDIGLSRDLLGRLVSGMGGGMGGTGHTCGAVTGAALVLSAQLGHRTQNDEDPDQLAKKAVGAFIDRFHDRHGQVSCAGLIGIDVRNEQAKEEARAVGAYRLTCPEVVRSAAALVAEILEYAEREKS